MHPLLAYAPICRSVELGVEVRSAYHRNSSSGGVSGEDGGGPAARVMFACASASEDRENWGPPRVITRLRVAPPPQVGGEPPLRLIRATTRI